MSMPQPRNAPIAGKVAMTHTSGYQQPVWISTEPYKNYPSFPRLSRDVTGTDVVVVGAGIAGISVAYECVQKGLHVTLIDAREVLSGETGRTSGHLTSALDDRYYELIKAHGEASAKEAYNSHQYALERVGEVSQREGIECEYRQLPAYLIVQVSDTHGHYKAKNDLPQELQACQRLGIKVSYEHARKIGESYSGDVLEFPAQATFHPTKYLNGLLKVLSTKYSNLFEAYSHTRMLSHKDHGTSVMVHTDTEHQITAKHMVMTTNVPIQTIDVIVKEAYYRTYCIAMRAPKDAYPDVLIYDNGDPYVYVKKTAHPDPSCEYIIVGGEDHKVGQESTEGYERHYENLIEWTRKNFPLVQETEYKWSGQIVEPADYLAFIGHNPGTENNVYISTGDSGNGLTHGVIAGRLITDLIMGVQNPWASLYDPSRKPSARKLPEATMENLNQQKNYARYLKTDVSDIESIPFCSGAVMRGGVSKLGKPLAVYKDGEGNVSRFSAICPHLHGVVAWNATEKSWDCPVHGSRFDGTTGKCVMGPANKGLAVEDIAAGYAQDGVPG